MKSHQIIKKAVELGKKYKSGELDEEREIRAYEAIQSIEAAENRKRLLFFGVLGIVTNILLWLGMIFLHSQFSFVIDFCLGFNKIGALVFLIPFALGFWPVFIFLRLRKPAKDSVEQFEPGLMKTYSYSAESESSYKIWIIAGLAGSLNLCLLVLDYWFF